MESANLNDDPHLGKIYAAAMAMHFSLLRRKQSTPPAPIRQTLEALVAAHPASANTLADALEKMNAESYANTVSALRSMAARAVSRRILAEIEGEGVE